MFVLQHLRGSRIIVGKGFTYIKEQLDASNSHRIDDVVRITSVELSLNGPVSLTFVWPIYHGFILNYDAWIMAVTLPNAQQSFNT